MTLTRRAVFRAAAAAAVATLAGCGAGGYQGTERTIRIAGGQRGGVYLEVAKLLAEEISATEPNLRCTALETRGSVQNVRMIRSGEADIGVSQSDMALAALDGTDPFDGKLALRGIGRMYEDYLQLVVLNDSEFRTITDLDERRVSTGPGGSGSMITGQRLLSAAHVTVIEEHESLGPAAAELAAGDLDAVVWCGGLPTPVLQRLDGDVGIRLLPLGGVLPALRTRYVTAYQKVTLPAGVYGQPGTPGIGVANLLLCGRSLPDDVVAAITHVLVRCAARLVPSHALGTQFLDPGALICLLGVPMHPGAVSAYRQLHG